MINIREIKRATFKKELGAKISSFRWHNKNKNGGNFGIEIRGIGKKDYELSGYYDKDGIVSSLRFGYIYQAGYVVSNLVTTFPELLESIKLYVSADNMEKYG